MKEQQLEGLELYQLYERMEPLVAPANISRLPQGPGWWWLLAFVIIVLMSYFTWRQYKRYRNRHRYYAIAELEQLQGNFSALDVSAILKRCALQQFPRTKVASLSGQAWTDFLNHTVPDQKRSRAQFSDFYQLHYQPQEFDRNELKIKARYWLLHFEAVQNEQGEHA